MVYLLPRSVVEQLDTSTPVVMLLVAWTLIVLTLMACPSLMIHLATTCGHMLMVTLNLIRHQQQIAPVLCMFSGSPRPSFVQDHYYCESGNVGGAEGQWYADDPLWDGEGCPTGNTCCDPPNLPWFSRIIGMPSTAEIELRLCQNEGDGNEDVSVEQFELYVY